MIKLILYLRFFSFTGRNIISLMKEEKVTAMQCLPDSLVGREYYRPTEQGVEGRFKTRLEQIKEWRRMQRREE